MRVALIFVLFLSWSQELKAKKTNDVLGILRNDIVSLRYDRQTRSLVDVWNSIKNKANQAWESIKNVANTSKKKIADLIQKIKYKAHDLNKKFEARLNEIKDHINDVIDKVINTGEVVKKCLHERKKSIDEILKNILIDVISCLSNSLSHLDNIESTPHEPVPNRTEFLKTVEEQLSLCLTRSDANDVEDCFHNVKMNIYENMEMTEEDILQNHVKIRSSTNDILDKIVRCTTDGMIRASSIIGNETVLIVQCVSQG